MAFSRSGPDPALTPGGLPCRAFTDVDSGFRVFAVLETLDPLVCFLGDVGSLVGAGLLS